MVPMSRQQPGRHSSSAASPETRVLVVGTTTDYVHWIDRAWPGRAMFLTDPAERGRAVEPAPDARTELLEDLRHRQRVRRSLADHLRRHHMRLGGITCYDCESLSLAAWLAQSFELPYPSVDSINLCRDKLECKTAWRACGVPCPEASLVCSSEEAVEFLRQMGGVCVLKPPTGSGSEYVFLCRSPAEAAAAVQTIRQNMARLADSRMYAGVGERIVAEQHIEGGEYSCDFLLEDFGLRIIRVARKIRLPRGPFGTIHGYEVPAELPTSVSRLRLASVLQQAASALGLRRSVCMADFIATPAGTVMLELTPRPGGDCLPQLIRSAAGLDMLGLTLDVAEGRPIHLPPPNRWTRHAAVRIHADAGGVLQNVDVTDVAADTRVVDITLSREPGHVVTLPPEKYDLWVLGFILFRPDPAGDVATQCDEILRKVRVKIGGVA